MASADTLRMLEQHPEWIAPRSDVRVFLGEPGAPEATKTTVEPGNTFSPGMRTFGVTWWLRFPTTGAFFAPELAPQDTLRWSYERGYLPLIHCETCVEGVDVRHSLFQDGTAAEQSEAVCARLQLSNLHNSPVEVQVFIALRSLGPAGGPLPDLCVGADRSSFRLAKRNLPLLVLDAAPSAIGCGVGDPSPLACAGQTPPHVQVADPQGWCFGLARFDITLAPGAIWQVHLDCPLQTYGNLMHEFPGRAQPRPQHFQRRAERHLANWQERLGVVVIEAPDGNFCNAFYAGLQHMLTAVVGNQARITPLAYPLAWLRDSVYIIRCLDLAGCHELARATTDYCARNDFFGGFGAEGDAPGEGIWALVEHYRITRDREWLASVYPAIRRKSDWLFRMRRTDRPIQIFVDTPVLAFTHAERASGVICVAARDGLIQGAMDHGVDYSLGWINQWALGGLRAAAFAASELGYDEDAKAYTTEADVLQQALIAHIAAHPEYLDYERTVNSLLWPTRAWEQAPDAVAAGFRHWWVENRGVDDVYKPEPYWLYFEFAQAHNALLFGERDWAWRTVQFRLAHQDLPGLYGWREGADGVGTDNAIYGVTLINQLRGCHRFDSITPHGWSQAELWLLQRAMLLDEWQNGLLLFAGVPAAWLTPGAQIRIRHAPTWYGRATAAAVVDTTGRQVTVTLTGVAPHTPIWIHLPGIKSEGCADENGALTTHFDLPGE